MKNVRRWLSAMLCLFMLVGMLPADVVSALAEAEIAAPAETVAAFAAEAEFTGEAAETPQTQETSDETPAESEAPQATEQQTSAPAETEAPETAETEMPEQAATAAPAQTEEPAQSGAEPSVTDTEKDATYSPDFAEGYAWVLKDAFAYPSAEAAAEAFVGVYAENIVYVSARETTETVDRLEVHFSSEGREATVAWMDAEVLRPMDAAEVEAFVQARVLEEDVEYYLDDGELPLALVSCLFREDYLAGLEAEAADEPAAEGDRTEEIPAEELPQEVLLPSVEDAASLKQEELIPSEGNVPEADVSGDEAESGELKEETLLPDNVQTASLELLTGSESGDEAGADVSDVQKDEQEVDAQSTERVQAAAVSVYAGESVQLTAAYMFGAEIEGSVSWTIEGGAATVTAEGLVTGVSAGTATVTATAADGSSAVCEINVSERPVITAAEIEVYIGTPVQATAEHMFGEAVEIAKWTIEGDAAAVSEAGLVTALKAGEATLKAEAADGRRAQATVRALVPPTVEAQAIEVYVGRPVQVTAEQMFGASVENITWTIEGAAATVNETGLVSGVEEGTAILKAQAADGRTAQAAVSVKKVGMILDVEAITLGKGEYFTITGSFTDGGSHAVSFATAKKSIASVTDGGKVKGVAVGSTTITVTSEFGESIEIPVTVKKAPTSVTMTPAKATMGVGEENSMTVKLSSGAAGKLTFTSSNENAVKIDAEGNVTAVGVGKSTITVKAFNGKKDTSTITVQAAPGSLELGEPTLLMGVEQVYQINPVIPEDTYTTLTYGLSKEGVVSVDAKTGELTAVAPGDVVVTATTHNGHSDSIAVEVRPAPTGISLNMSELTLGVNQKSEPVQVTLQGEKDCYTELTFKSSKSKYVSVDSNGVIKGLRTGSATITVSTHNGYSAKIKVTVKKAPTSVKVSPTSATMGINETGQLKLTFTKNSVCSYSFCDYDPEIISVSATGEVRALKEGSTQITVLTHNNKKAYCTITVKAEPTSITIGEGDLLMGVKQEYALQALLSKDSAGKVTFSSSNAAAVEVDPDSGELKAVGVGTAVITAELYNKLKATRTVVVKAAPSKITVSPKTITIGVGEIVGPLDVTLGAEGEDCEGSYTIKSSSSKYVAVNADGEIKGVRTGKATLTYKTHNGKTAKVTVTVKKAPTSLTMTPDHVVLGVGEKTKLSWKVSSGAAGGITMGEYDTNTISVSESNEVTALNVGTTVVTVRTYNGIPATCTIEVKPEPESITLSDTEKTLGVGQKFTLSATLNEGSAGAYKFISSDEKTATVDEKTGEVKAVKAGPVEIRAEAYNGVDEVCKVTVKAAPSKITVTPKTITIGVGEIVGPLDVTLGAEGEDCEGSYTLKSSSTKYVKVNAYGQILGVRAGKATVTYKTHNGKTAKVTVTVKKAPTSVTVTPKAGVLGVGETGQLSWKLSSGSVGGVEFLDYDAKILDVSAAGLVTAVGPGTTTITVRTFNGHEDYCTITVKNAPTGVSLDPSSLALGKGEVAMLQAVLEGDSAGSCTFTSDNTAVAKVGAKTGTVTAVSVGTANITVETYNKWKATIPVTVSAAPAGIHFQEESVTVVAGDTYQLLAPVLEGAGVACSEYEYASSNEAIMTVSPSGLITGVKPGTARVKVSTYNGEYDIIYVYVGQAPASVWFEPDAIEMYPGQEVEPEVRFSNAVECSYELSVPEEYAETVEVEWDGVTVRALKPGKAEVIVNSIGGLTAKLTVNVLELPDSVELNAESVTLGQRETFQLKATMPENQGSSLEYTSSDEAIATVDENGLVRGVTPGDVTITVETLNGKTDTCAVKVMAEPTNVTLTPEEAIRAIDEKELQLTVGFGAAGEGGGYSLASSDEEIATVSAEGLVTFVSTGIVEITVKTYNNYTATSVIEITEAAGGIAFAQTEVKIAQGDTVYIPVEFTSGGGSYTLAAEDGDIVSVEGSRVKGLEIGSTTLTATTYNGLTATCTVTVVAAPTEITLDWESLELDVGDEWQLTARTNAEDGVGSYSFASSAEDIAAVDEKTGLITALAHGEATITVTTYDGLRTATCQVKVNGMPTYRALIAGEYAKSSDDGYLPFSANNVNGMEAALEQANIDGIQYSEIVTGTNRGKTRILDQIRTQFADAKPYDVSVIYICAHGLRKVTGGSEYVLTMTGYEGSKTAPYYITATELMAAVNTVPGKVILILDSCYSGGFLTKFGSMVESNPNLAVLCAAGADTKGSYWNTTGSDAVDFYTYSLLEGIGYEEKTGTTLPLNADANGDGAVSVSEAAAYAKSATVGYVTSLKNHSKFAGSAAQTPVYSIGGMENVPFYAR